MMPFADKKSHYEYDRIIHTLSKAQLISIAHVHENFIKVLNDMSNKYALQRLLEKSF